MVLVAFESSALVGGWCMRASCAHSARLWGKGWPSSVICTGSEKILWHAFGLTLDAIPERGCVRCCTLLGDMSAGAQAWLDRTGSSNTSQPPSAQAVPAEGAGKNSGLLELEKDHAELVGLEMGELLGRGSYGRVYRGRRPAECSCVAPACEWCTAG